VRRKAALALYKCFLRYPESLRPSFARLTERLEDDDPGVVSSVVSVLCELATHNPRTYLPLAPTFYKLLTTSSNNWMTIKLVKVFGALAPLEPRLGKKLAEPLAHIMATTGAKSVLYECIRAVVGGMTQQPGLVQLCVEKLADFVCESDPNLKFLGLQALQGLLAEHPKAVAYHRATIFACLEAGDPTIQLSALALVTGLVTRRSLMETVVRLMEHMRSAEGALRDELVASVLVMCARDRYALLTDFAWYVAVLAELARVRGTKHGAEVGRQIIDVAVRVDAVQPDAVRLLRPLLLDPALAEERADNVSVAEALRAAAWVTGEYAHYIAAPRETLEALLQPAVCGLPPRTQQVYVAAVLKVLLSAVQPRAPPGAPRAAAMSAPAAAAAAPAAPAAAASGEEHGEAGAENDELVASLGADTPADAHAPGVAAAAAAAASAAAAAAVDAAEEAAADAAARAAAAEAEAAWEAPPVRPPASDEELASLRALVAAHISPLARSTHLEVRERACELAALLRAADAAEAAGGPSAARALLRAFGDACATELLPVSTKAQRRVVPPPGLDLGAPMPWEAERAERREKKAAAAAAASAAAAAEKAAASSGGPTPRRAALLAAAAGEGGGEGGRERRGSRRRSSRAGAGDEAPAGVEEEDSDDSDDSLGGGGGGGRHGGGLLLKRKTRAERERDNEVARAAAAAHRERNAQFYIGGAPPEEEEPPLRLPGGEEDDGQGAYNSHQGGAGADGHGGYGGGQPSGGSRERALPAWAAPSARGGQRGVRAAVKGNAGDDDDDDDDDDAAARAMHRGGAAYAPSASVESQHASLQGVDLLSPLDGDESLPTVAAYPRAQHAGGYGGRGGAPGGWEAQQAMAAQQGGDAYGGGGGEEGGRERRHKEGKERKEHKEGKERRHHKEGKEAKEGKEKREKHRDRGGEEGGGEDAAALAGDKERRKAMLKEHKERRQRAEGAAAE
jgi:hypothetical protein